MPNIVRPQHHTTMATTQKCSVPDCGEPAYAEVLLYDVYANDDGEIFTERDYTCPFMCRKHIMENENSCKGVREPRRSCVYPYSNQHKAQGFTIYRPLDNE